MSNRKSKQRRSRQVEAHNSRKQSRNEDPIVLETKQFIAARNKYYDSRYSPAVYRFFLILFIISIAAIIGYSLLVLRNLISPNTTLLLFFCFVTALSGLTSIGERLRNEAAHSSGNEREKLLWRMGQFQALYRPILAISVIYFLNFINKDINPIVLYTLLIVSSIAYGMYAIVMLIVLNDLKLFLSKSLGAIGSLSATIAYLGLFISIIVHSYYLFLSVGGPETILSALIGAFYLLSRWKLILKPVIITFEALTAKKMNYIQQQILTIIPLGMILSQVNSYYQILKDKKEAIAARLKVYKTLSEGAQYQLIKLIAEDGKSMQISYAWFFSTLFAFIGIVGTIIGILVDWQEFTTIIKSILLR